MFDYIPPELMPNILARLSIDDVLRCTSVCKSWYELITSSDFISLHLNLSIPNTQPRLLVRSTTTEDLIPRYHLHDDNQTFNQIQEFEFPRKAFGGLCVRGSSNGLIFCVDFVDKIMLLWNPSLKKSLILPTTRRHESLFGGMGGQCNVGFGFLPGTNNYKIVRVLYKRISGGDGGFLVPPEVEIYNSLASSWSNVDAALSYVIYKYCFYPAILKGSVHWIGGNPYNFGGTFKSLIVSFDLTSEKFGALMLPKILQNEAPNTFSVSTVKDSLYMIHIANELTSIYVLKEYGIADSWENLCNIDISLEPLYFRENGEILSELSNKCNLRSYDPKSNKVMDLEVREEGRWGFLIYPYVNSLFLIQDSNLEG